MFWVHVRVYLKNEAGEIFFVRFHFSGVAVFRTGSGGDADKAVQQLSYSKVVQSRSEEDRLQISVQVILFIEFRINSLSKL